MTTAEGLVRSLMPVIDALDSGALLLAADPVRADLHVRFANQAFLRYLGVGRRDVVDRPLADLVSEECRGRILSDIPARFVDGAPFAVRAELAGCDGRRFVANLHMHPVPNGGEGPAFWFARLSTAPSVAERVDGADLEASYRHLAENHPALICRFLPDTTLTFVNRACATHFGRPAAELLGRRFIDLVEPEYTEVILRQLSAVTPDRPYCRMEYPTPTNGGSVHWHLWQHFAFFNGLGGPVLFQSVGTDTTRCKIAEARLRESEKRIRDITDAIPSRIAYVDRDQTYRFVNRAYELETHRPRSSIIGKTVRAFLGEDVYSSITHHIDATLAGRRVSYDYVHKAPDGEIHREVTYVPDTDENGTVQGFYTFVHDVTAHRRSEDAIFAEKERAEVTLDSIGDAVITTDAFGLIDYVNPVAQALTGRTATAAIGLPAQDIVCLLDERTGWSAPNPIVACLESRRVVMPSGDLILASHRGGEIPVEATAAPIRRQSGEILGTVLVLRDVTEDRRQARQLAHDATHDPLTGLVNRREFERRVGRAVASARQYGWRHALCFLDLDRFKQVNDVAGHTAGDALLAQIRGLLAGKFRERDTLARLGGDEFGLLLDACVIDEAMRIAEIIVAAFRDFRFEWSGRSFHIGVSIGIVAIDAGAVTTDQLLTWADVACYTAKQQGGGRVCVHRSRGSEARGLGDVVLASRLQEALDHRQFRLFCQPIRPLVESARAITFWEVLLRLPDASGEIVMPDSFVPAAERYGLMSQVDRWVIENAFRFYAEALKGRDTIGLAINLSANSMSDEMIVDYIEAQLDRFSVPPERVCFEVPEKLAARHVADAATLSRAIRALGMRLALDDFGAGMSSFACLKALQVDVIKIDGSLVRELGGSCVDTAVVSAAQTVGRAMGIETVGEFACNDRVVQCLRELGVDHAQGYAFGPPRPLDELASVATA